MAETFEFLGKTYAYFNHRRNQTRLSERAVEIPIVWDAMEQSRGKRVLEVGNVLSQYFPVTHDILDKYEKRDGVINQDIVDFDPPGRYDLIVCISTLEHIGWDESPREPGKILRALENLRNLLKPGGKLVVTVPLGYNQDLDRLLKNGTIHFSEQYCLRRLPDSNDWEVVNWEEVRRNECHPIITSLGVFPDGSLPPDQGIEWFSRYITYVVIGFDKKEEIRV